jgi:hypothetical protein
LIQYQNGCLQSGISECHLSAQAIGTWTERPVFNRRDIREVERGDAMTLAFAMLVVVPAARLIWRRLGAANPPV